MSSVNEPAVSQKQSPSQERTSFDELVDILISVPGEEVQSELKRTKKVRGARVTAAPTPPEPGYESEDLNSKNLP